MKTALALLALFVAAPAAGQQSTTDCLSLPGGNLSCTTRQSPSSQPVDQTRTLQQGANLVAPYQRTPSTYQPSGDQRLMAAMSRLIADKRCPEAIDVALRNGRMDLAERAKALCEGR